MFAFVLLPLLEVAAEPEPEDMGPVYAEYAEKDEEVEVEGPGLELREVEEVLLCEEKPGTEAVGERSSLASSGKNESTVVSAVRRRCIVK